MSSSICIVWPAWFPGSTDPELHVTALFLGRTDTATFSRGEVEDSLVNWHPGWQDVTGIEMFGRSKDIPVLTLAHNPKLSTAWARMAYKLSLRDIEADDSFPFKPHVTIAKEAEHIQDSYIFRPSLVELERPVLWWGDDRPVHTKHAKVSA